MPDDLQIALIEIELEQMDMSYLVKVIRRAAENPYSLWSVTQRKALEELESRAHRVDDLVDRAWA